MSNWKKHTLGFIAGLGLTASAFIGAYLHAQPAVASDPAACPAYPPTYTITGRAGMRCVGGNCVLQDGCQLPIYAPNPIWRVGNTTCSDIGSTCIMGPQCLADCTP